MKRFLQILTAAATLLLALACEKEEELQQPVLEGTGISNVSWTSTVTADEEGEMLSLTFTAAGSWVAESSAPEWCEILTGNGVEGDAALRINVAKNVATEGRTAEITITVANYTSAEKFTIAQSEGVTEQGDGRYREINEWVYEKMASHYLWNEPVKTIALDYSIGYQAFLKSILDGVAKQGDVNHDDGVYNGEFRTEYYTQIVSAAPETKSVGQESRGNGFYLLRPVNLGTAIGVLIDTVIPGGPADQLGLKRGHFITEVNGVSITMDNYKSVTSKIYKDALSIKVSSVSWEGKNLDEAVLTKVGTFDIAPAYYTEPAIYKAETVELSNGKKVGYLLYMGFHTDFDEDLMEVFDKFKADGIEDLVIDLRYNNGGEILSSAVMATMIAGEAHKGKTLAKLVYNKERTDAGKSDSYRIGIKETVEYPDGYLPIEDALQHAIGLDRVFVIATGTTASASEIIINGLRGLDIEVNLIGTRTSGKNVGMEGFSKKYRNYDFLFYPVSFYIENAKGFSDYPDGFTPDVNFDDSGFYPGGDFGSNEDYLCNIAYGWIRTGSKPSRTFMTPNSVELDPISNPTLTRMGGSRTAIVE